jgi:type II secretory pathway component PulF
VNHYSFKAVAADGQVVRGSVEAPSDEAVDGILRARDLYLLQARRTSKLYNQMQKGYRAWGIKRKDIIEFCSNLSIMIRGGVPILSALDDIIATVSNKYFRSVIEDVKKNIEMGTTFTEALSHHQAVFPDAMIRLVTVGEETGRFEESLADVARHLQKMEDLAEMVKRALIYPVFAMITTGGALIFWLAYVLPKIMQVIVSLGVPLPWLTRFLFEVSQFTEKYWYLLPIIPCIPVLIVQFMKLKPATKYYWDRAKMRLPIVKLLVHNKLIALFCEQTRIMIAAGISIDRTMDVVAEVMGSEVFKRAILKAKDDIIAGSRIAEALKVTQAFPLLVIRMVDIGETSGSLEEQFDFLAQEYFKKVDNVSEKLGKLIEPLMLIVIGLMLGIMIVGVLLPIYDIFGKIGT